MIRLRKLVGRFRLSSLEPEEYEGGGRRPIDSIDALAAPSTRGEKSDPQVGEFPDSVPPSYSKIRGIE